MVALGQLKGDGVHIVAIGVGQLNLRAGPSVEGSTGDVHGAAHGLLTHVHIESDFRIGDDDFLAFVTAVEADGVEHHVG